MMHEASEAPSDVPGVQIITTKLTNPGRKEMNQLWSGIRSVNIQYSMINVQFFVGGNCRLPGIL